MRSFLERGIPFDDVVAFNDVIALGAIARGAARSAEDTRRWTGEAGL
jgi:DNA-binding LacI/PurR family transcriptional regulator